MFLRHLVGLPWPSFDTRGKFYGDRSREPLRWGGGGVKHKRGSQIYSDFGAFGGHIKIGGKLVLITNRKSYMSFRLVLKLVTLNDRERRTGPYLALFYRIWWVPGALRKSG